MARFSYRSNLFEMTPTEKNRGFRVEDFIFPNHTLLYHRRHIKVKLDAREKRGQVSQELSVIIDSLF